MSEAYDTPRGFDDYDYCPKHDLVLNMGTLCPKCITHMCGHCGKRITGSIQKCSNDGICTMKGQRPPFIDRECEYCGFQWYENYATEQCPSCENRKVGKR